MSVKVEIYRNKFVVWANGSSKTLLPASDFSTTRLLVGNFLEAEKCLSTGFKEMKIMPYFRFLRPAVHMYPKEMSEGGLCGVEERVLYELAACTGARKIEIHA